MVSVLVQLTLILYMAGPIIHHKQQWLWENVSLKFWKVTWNDLDCAALWPFTPPELFLWCSPKFFLFSLNKIWYLPSPLTTANLLPELKSVMKRSGVCFWCQTAERSEANFFVVWNNIILCQILYSMLPKSLSSAPCSMDFFASCSRPPSCFGPHSPGSLKPLTESQW